MNVCQISPIRKKNYAACAFLLCLLAAVLAGCGGGGQTEYVETDEGDVRLALSDVSGAASDPDEFRALFVEGAAPADSERPKYAPFMYRANSLEIEGNTATAMVEIEDGNTGQIVGELEWTLVRQGDEWKIQSAPLP
jgi:hypothetical protein